MSPDEQEALSIHHSTGFWLVPLRSGAFAVFDHPNGKLLEIYSSMWGESTKDFLRSQGIAAKQRYDKKKVGPKRTQQPKIDLEGIEL